MNEIWKDIEGYEGLYQVSNLGRVRSLERFNVNSGVYQNRVRVLKQSHNRRGYKTVTLIKRKARKTVTVHRLVAKAFLENPKMLPQVNHKDENKENNAVGNLEWCDNRYNYSYGTRVERVTKKLQKPILQFDENGNFINEFSGLRDAQRALNLTSSGSISECCNGKRATAFGYIWRYKEVK